MSAVLVLNLATSARADIVSDWLAKTFKDVNLNHNFTGKDFQDAGVLLDSAARVLGEEVKEAAVAGVQVIINHAPELTEQVKKSCEEINRTVKILANPLKTLPLGGVGLASTIAGFVLLYKSIDAYCSLEESHDGSESNDQRIESRVALKRGLSGLALIIAGLATIIKSDSIVNQFA